MSLDKKTLEICENIAYALTEITFTWSGPLLPGQSVPTNHYERLQKIADENTKNLVSLFEKLIYNRAVKLDQED